MTLADLPVRTVLLCHDDIPRGTRDDAAEALRIQKRRDTIKRWQRENRAKRNAARARLRASRRAARESHA